MSEVMKPEALDVCLATSIFERCPDIMEWNACFSFPRPSRKNKISFMLSREFAKDPSEAVRNRNMPGCAILGLPEEDQTSTEIDILPANPQDLAPPHPCFKRSDDNRSEVRRRTFDTLVCLLDGQIPCTPLRFLQWLH